MKKLALRMLPIADALISPFMYPCAWMLKNVRRAEIQRFPICRRALVKMGVFPVVNHYYEPQFDFRNERQSFSLERSLPGIDWNENEQLQMLEQLSFGDEIADLPKVKTAERDFHLNNGTFDAGDAEYWYQLIRHFKPSRIYEIGSGNSTLMAKKAIDKNHEDDSSYECEHICVEPYEVPWLEDIGVKVIREKVEDLDAGFFSELQENDVLFIDSSHIIRPQGDVLFEYLELLPTLNSGVIVHVHDIFSPKNYPKRWLEENVFFWNEQYLLEAFLINNSGWKIIGALNFLRHNHFEKLKAVAQFLTPEREPGSFYLQKIV